MATDTTRPLAAVLAEMNTYVQQVASMTPEQWELVDASHDTVPRVRARLDVVQAARDTGRRDQWWDLRHMLAMVEPPRLPQELSFAALCAGWAVLMRDAISRECFEEMTAPMRDTGMVLGGLR